MAEEHDAVGTKLFWHHPWSNKITSCIVSRLTGWNNYEMGACALVSWDICWCQSTPESTPDFTPDWQIVACTFVLERRINTLLSVAYLLVQSAYVAGVFYGVSLHACSSKEDLYVGLWLRLDDFSSETTASIQCEFVYIYNEGKRKWLPEPEAQSADLNLCFLRFSSPFVNIWIVLSFWKGKNHLFCFVPWHLFCKNCTVL